MSRQVWEAYHAPDRRSFGQRLRRLREWAGGTSAGSCWSRCWSCAAVEGTRWRTAPGRPPDEQHARPRDAGDEPILRRRSAPARLARGVPAPLRAWALLQNFAPWHPATTRENDGWRCPAERLNRHRYHDDWLQNLLVSASLGGYRRPIPQNPGRSGNCFRCFGPKFRARTTSHCSRKGRSAEQIDWYSDVSRPFF